LYLTITPIKFAFTISNYKKALPDFEEYFFLLKMMMDAIDEYAIT
jgi:hypothetical protein